MSRESQSHGLYRGERAHRKAQRILANFEDQRRRALAAVGLASDEVEEGLEA